MATDSEMDIELGPTDVENHAMPLVRLVVVSFFFFNKFSLFIKLKNLYKKFSVNIPSSALGQMRPQICLHQAKLELPLSWIC